MKNLKKILAVVLACIFAFSCFGMSAYAIGSKEEATNVNIRVTAPSVGGSASARSISCSQTSYFMLDGFTWAERAPGESSYHVMTNGSTFKEGYRYRIYVYYVSPTCDLNSINITINGNSPHGRRDDAYNSSGSVYYDFGTLGSSGSSGGNGGGGGIFRILLTILSVPLYLITLPFRILF